MTWRGFFVLLAATAVAGACSAAPTDPLPESLPDLTVPGGEAPPSEPLPLTDLEPEPEPGVTNATVRLDHCRFLEPGDWHVRCGWLSTPEAADEPGGDRVRLHFAVVRSRSEDPAPDPVVYLHGGPGAGILPWLSNASDFVIEPFIADRDVIVIDQRGAGLSEPVPLCRGVSWSLGAAPGESQDEAITATEEQLRACRESLADQGVDLAQYNSVASARDIEDLRIALGYGPWNIYGVSYGTRLAQTLMREHPEGVRSVILDSTYPTDVDLSTSLPSSVRRTLSTVLDACSTDPICASDHPNLADRLDSLLSKAAARPLVVPFDNDVIGSSGQETIGAAALLAVMHDIAYTPQGISALPALIDETESGDYSRLRRYLYDQGSYDDTIALTFLAVQCHEEIAFTNDALLSASRTGDVRYDEIDELVLGYGPSAPGMCDALDVGTADPVENEPVRSDLPTLVLSGAFDPITPPEWGQRVADHLSNSTLIESGRASHGLVGDQGCVDEAVGAFLAAPGGTVTDTCEDAGHPELVGVSHPSALPASERVTVRSSTSSVTLDIPSTWIDEEGGDYDHLVLRTRQADLWDRTALAVVVGPDLDLDAGVLGEVLGDSAELRALFSEPGTGSDDPSIAAYLLPSGDIAWYIWFDTGPDTVAIVLVGHPADAGDLFDDLLIPLLEGMDIQ